MPRSTPRPRWSLLLFISALALLLAACANTAASDAVEQETALELNPQPANTPEPPSTQPAPEVVEPAEENDVIESDAVPERFRSLTAQWGTDFTRYTVPPEEIISGGVPRDGIRSIDEPEFVGFDETSEWLEDTEPVIALELNGQARAYPLSILTRHEIVNDEMGGIPIAVTYCPLCNSALVFDRRVDGQVYEFGVSGLLRNSDLVMYDRTTESLWQQFTGEGIVGEHAGDQLDIYPSTLVSYADFRAAYPDGEVLSTMGRPYGENPYAGYDQREGRPFLFTGQLDERLPAMMRVVGIEVDGEMKAYPYDVLSEQRVVHDAVGGQEVVIFFRFGTNSALGARVIAEAEDVGAAAAYDPSLSGQTLTFRVEGDEFVDEQTGSTWNILGQAVAGELAGEQLSPVVYHSDFWFSWAAFFPQTAIYTGEEAEMSSGEANADVTFVRAVQGEDGVWTFHVTVEHPDTGWEDYADGWDVVAPDGTVLKPDPDSAFTRTLLHPHENEQPFTRSQGGIAIPDGVTEVRVRAHDIVDGFGGREVVVDLTRDAGEGYKVERAGE